MKKILTLTAAILASFSLWAAVTTLSLPVPAEEGGNDVYTYSTTSEIKVKNIEALWIEIPSASLSGNISVKASGNNNSRYLYIHKENGATQDASRKIVMSTSYQEFAFTASDIKTDGGKYYLVFSTGDDYKMNSECAKLSVPASAPTTPVSSVVVSGQNVVFVGHKITLTATPDQKANAYYWEKDGVKITGAETATYEFQPDAAGTVTFKAFARNDNNAAGQYIESSAFSVTVNALNDRVDVSESITWDFSKISAETEIQLTNSTDPAKGDTFLLANAADVVNDANFNSQALEFSGEYIIRDKKYCQGSLLRFNTTVPGKLTIEYCNTGNRSNEADRRFLNVNGKQVGEGTLRSDENATTSDIAVAAGEVVIVGVFNEGDPATAPQYLRFYKVIFTKDTGTAIDNTDAAVKATKVLRDGQVLILRDGKFFNALGVEVK